MRDDISNMKARLNENLESENDFLTQRFELSSQGPQAVSPRTVATRLSNIDKQASKRFWAECMRILEDDNANIMPWMLLLEWIRENWPTNSVDEAIQILEQSPEDIKWYQRLRLELARQQE